MLGMLIENANKFPQNPYAINNNSGKAFKTIQRKK